MSCKVNLTVDNKERKVNMSVQERVIVYQIGDDILRDYQKKLDDELETISKTVVGAINELNENTVKKVENGSNEVYGVDSEGNETTFKVSVSEDEPNSIVQRSPWGDVKVELVPQNPESATSMDFVEKSISSVSEAGKLAVDYLENGVNWAKPAFISLWTANSGTLYNNGGLLSMHKRETFDVGEVRFDSNILKLMVGYGFNKIKLSTYGTWGNFWCAVKDPNSDGDLSSTNGNTYTKDSPWNVDIYLADLLNETTNEYELTLTCAGWWVNSGIWTLSSLLFTIDDEEKGVLDFYLKKNYNTGSNRLYGINADGEQTIFGITTGTNANAIVRRKSNRDISALLEPLTSDSCVSMQYSDRPIFKMMANLGVDSLNWCYSGAEEFWTISSNEMSFENKVIKLKNVDNVKDSILSLDSRIISSMVEKGATKVRLSFYNDSGFILWVRLYSDKYASGYTEFGGSQYTSSKLLTKDINLSDLYNSETNSYSLSFRVINWNYDKCWYVSNVQFISDDTSKLSIYQTPQYMHNVVVSGDNDNMSNVVHIISPRATAYDKDSFLRDVVLYPTTLTNADETYCSKVFAVNLTNSALIYHDDNDDFVAYYVNGITSDNFYKL